jgi:D-serine deaminase-like pyridoxal phosphate-dependent protein
VVAQAGQKRIRVASKSVRSIALLRRILAANPRIQGVMCFTAREAVYLAGLGFDDLLIGYPAVHPADLAEVTRATADGARITLMVDSGEQGVRLPLCLELDMSLDVPRLHFGVWRSPLRTAEQARPVIARIQSSEHVWLDGVMGYEAQIAGIGDNTAKRARNLLIRALKRRSATDVARRRAELVALIKSLGGRLRFVNGGGTGSLRTTRAEPAVTEITVGSGFYSPALFDSYRDFRYQPAAGFAVEIVRRPQPDIYTCLGGGYVASGSAGKEKLPAVSLPQGAKLEALEGAGEVQTPVRYRGPEKLDIGDPIFMRHAKAGELCERFTHLLLVQDGKVVETVPTYRGDGQNFL